MFGVQERMRELTGRYETYIGIEAVEVNYKAGMLFLESETPFAKTSTPLIPEDSMVEEPVFYTIVDGVKSPVVFERKGDGFDLFVERYCYHRV
jgi:hypothetical protein